MRCRKRTATTGTFAARICRWTRRTTPISTPAFPRGRSPHRAKRHSTPHSRRLTCRTSTSSAGTTARTCSRELSPNTMPMSASFRSSISGLRESKSARRQDQLALAPLQLLAEQLEITALGCLDEPQALLRLADVNHIPRVDGIPVLPVVGDEYIIATVR